MTDPPTQCWFSLSIMGGEIWKWGGKEVNMGSMNRRADMFYSSRSDHVLGWLQQCKSWGWCQWGRRFWVISWNKDKPAGVLIFGRQAGRPTHSGAVRPPPSCTFILGCSPRNPFIAGKCIPRAHLHFSHSTHFTLPPSLRQTSVCSATSICFIQYLCGGSTARGEILKVLPTGVIHYREHFRSPHSQKEGCLPIRLVSDPPSPHFAS